MHRTTIYACVGSRHTKDSAHGLYHVSVTHPFALTRGPLTPQYEEAIGKLAHCAHLAMKSVLAPTLIAKFPPYYLLPSGQPIPARISHETESLQWQISNRTSLSEAFPLMSCGCWRTRLGPEKGDTAPTRWAINTAQQSLLHAQKFTGREWENMSEREERLVLADIKHQNADKYPFGLAIEVFPDKSWLPAWAMVAQPQ